MTGSNFNAQLTSTVRISFTDNNGYATFAECEGAPPTTASTFAHGCIIRRTDSGTGVKSIYENIGSVAVPSWNLIGDISASEITLANGQILVGNASNIATAVTVSGDATISNVGVVSLSGSTLKVAKTTVLTANVLTMFTTPIAIVPAAAAGTANVVDRIIASIDYNSIAYATNTTLEFRYTNGSGTKVTADITALLTATADTVITVGGIEAALVATPAAPVVAVVATGDPTAGNSPISITAVYRVVTI